MTTPLLPYDETDAAFQRWMMNQPKNPALSGYQQWMLNRPQPAQTLTPTPGPTWNPTPTNPPLMGLPPYNPHPPLTGPQYQPAAPEVLPPAQSGYSKAMQNRPQSPYANWSWINGQNINPFYPAENLAVTAPVYNTIPSGPKEQLLSGGGGGGGGGSYYPAYPYYSGYSSPAYSWMSKLLNWNVNR